MKDEAETIDFKDSPIISVRQLSDDTSNPKVNVEFTRDGYTGVVESDWDTLSILNEALNVFFGIPHTTDDN